MWLSTKREGAKLSRFDCFFSVAFRWLQLGAHHLWGAAPQAGAQYTVAVSAFDDHYQKREHRDPLR